MQDLFPAVARACGADPVAVAFTVVALAAGGIGRSASAQERPVPPAGAAEEIGGRLRAFYFNLAHGDWEALTADILAAKVVAHRPAPEIRSPVFHTLDPSSSGSGEVVCSVSLPVSIQQAVIQVEGDWAQAIVPHCPPGRGDDQFRLIRFAGRWRFVGIHLEQRVSVTAER